MAEHQCPKTAAARRNEPQLRKNEDLEVDFEWVILWGLRMGFSYDEVRHMEFGKWMDFFTTYKTIHNMTVSQSIFPEPRKVESLSIL